MPVLGSRATSCRPLATKGWDVMSNPNKTPDVLTQRRFGRLLKIHGGDNALVPNPMVTTRNAIITAVWCGIGIPVSTLEGAASARSPTVPASTSISGQGRIHAGVTSLITWLVERMPYSRVWCVQPMEVTQVVLNAGFVNCNTRRTGRRRLRNIPGHQDSDQAEGCSDASRNWSCGWRMWWSEEHWSTGPKDDHRVNERCSLK